MRQSLHFPDPIPDTRYIHLDCFHQFPIRFNSPIPCHYFKSFNLIFNLCYLLALLFILNSVIYFNFNLHKCYHLFFVIYRTRNIAPTFFVSIDIYKIFYIKKPGQILHCPSFFQPFLHDVKSTNKPTTTITNHTIVTTSFKSSFITFLFILILQMDYDIVALGRTTSPLLYWILSIIILITAIRVPISNAS